MTQQNPIAVLQQFLPQASQLTGAVQAGQNIMTQGLNQDLLRQKNQQAQIQTEALQSQQNISNTVNRLQEVERLIGFGATPEQIQAKLQGYIQESQASGGNPIDSQQALQVLQEGGIPALQQVMAQAKQVFQQQGLMKGPSAPTTADQFSKIDATKFTQDSLAAFQQSGRYSDLVPIAEKVDDPVFIKELRGELRTEVKDLQGQAAALKTNSEKLKGLVVEIDKGNRQAVAQALVSLVKLGDPTSVVKDSEMEAALNNQNPAAAVSSLLQGSQSQGVVESFVRKIDPLNPDTINTDELLATAQAMLAPNAESISGAYTLARGRGESHLSGGGFSTIFGEERDSLFDDVGQLTFDVQPIIQPEAQPEIQRSSGGIQFTVE